MTGVDSAERLRCRAGQKGGRHRIEFLLGRGGLGEVWKVRSFENERVFSLKIVRAGLDKKNDARSSGNEQRAMHRLDDPRIARFIERSSTSTSVRVWFWNGSTSSRCNRIAALGDRDSGDVHLHQVRGAQRMRLE